MHKYKFPLFEIVHQKFIIKQTFIKKILHFSLVLVGERLVGGAQVLEFLVGVGVVRVSIRVHLLGKFAVRLLDLVLVGVSPHAEDLVEVSPEATFNFGKYTCICITTVYVAKTKFLSCSNTCAQCTYCAFDIRQVRLLE